MVRVYFLIIFYTNENFLEASPPKKIPGYVLGVTEFLFCSVRYY